MKDEEEDNIIPNSEDDYQSEEGTFDENQEEESEEIIEVEAKHFEGQHFYENDENPEDTITKVTGMYKDWFLDYAKIKANWLLNIHYQKITNKFLLVNTKLFYLAKKI
nr:hypothetical protein [Flavobacterium sp.]